MPLSIFTGGKRMKTASFGWIVICVGAFAVIIAMVLSIVTIQSPQPKSSNTSEKPSPTTRAVTDIESALIVSPSGRLDIFIRQYENTVYLPPIYVPSSMWSAPCP